QRGQFVLVLVEQRLEIEQDAGALERRHFRPGGERRARRGHSRVDLGGRGQRDGTADLAGGGVEAFGVAAAAALAGLAGDEMSELLHGIQAISFSTLPIDWNISAICDSSIMSGGETASVSPV